MMEYSFFFIAVYIYKILFQGSWLQDFSFILSNIIKLHFECPFVLENFVKVNATSTTSNPALGIYQINIFVSGHHPQKITHESKSRKLISQILFHAAKMFI